MVNKKQIYIILGIIFTVFACKKGEDYLEHPLFAGFLKPANFPEPVYNFEHNKISEAGFNLGKKLFFDPLLSRDNSISCGSCHISHYAFTQHSHRVSHGIDDLEGIRNSMPIMNLAWANSFFWDGGVFHLDLAPIAPIENPVEMDDKMANVLRKLSASNTYPALFKQAFGSSEITSSAMLKALSQYMLMLVSDQSKYDKIQRGEAGQAFTEQEAKGYTIFKKNCNSCHQEPLFTDYSFRDNGIGINAENDLGRFEITLNPSDRGKFKVPSLRNLKYTPPYMHDGSFLNLRAVLNHYRDQIQQTENLDPLLKDKIPLTDMEVEDLLAFLNTLNDENFVKDKRFAE